MEKKFDIGAAVEGLGKNAISILDKAKDKLVNVADQDNDGDFDKEDVAAIADALGTAAKNVASAVKSGADEKFRELEKKLLQPVFAEDIDRADFVLPKLIRLTEVDKKHAESEVCQGSIGFVSDQKDLKIVNIFKDKADLFGIRFFPDAESELYYVDPTDRDKYIALDEYFEHLKSARINELQKIAQDLGAKHFRVIYKEEKTSFSGGTVKGKAESKIAKDIIKAEAEHSISTNTMAHAEIAAEMTCPGHAPVEPKLCYMQRDPTIQTLIALRMDETSPISHQKVSLRFINSSGIKEKDALKIDAALKAMKIIGNTTLTSEVQYEARRYFEYEIDF